MRNWHRALIGGGAVLGAHGLYSVGINRGVAGLLALGALIGVAYLSYVRLDRTPSRRGWAPADGLPIAATDDVVTVGEAPEVVAVAGSEEATADRERGAVAVEFAIILPLLVLLVMGAIEFGRVYSQYQVFQGAAREGARCAAVSGTGWSEPCDIEDRILESSGAYTPDLSTLSVTVGGTAATGPAWCEDHAGDNVAVAWQQPLELNIPFWPGGGGTFTADIEGVFRCE